mmetsp:Transcript_6319/g.12476  ORF Transcript_6319/g.12476 Transcript_6319/m.12476 type:complete len:202 (-) Transcript_6319:2513-3118(-)
MSSTTSVLMGGAVPFFFALISLSFFILSAFFIAAAREGSSWAGVGFSVGSAFPSLSSSTSMGDTSACPRAFALALPFCMVSWNLSTFLFVLLLKRSAFSAADNAAEALDMGASTSSVVASSSERREGAGACAFFFLFFFLNFERGSAPPSLSSSSADSFSFVLFFPFFFPSFSSFFKDSFIFFFFFFFSTLFWVACVRSCS